MARAPLGNRRPATPALAWPALAARAQRTRRQQRKGQPKAAFDASPDLASILPFVVTLGRDSSSTAHRKLVEQNSQSKGSAFFALHHRLLSTVNGR